MNTMQIRVGFCCVGLGCLVGKEDWFCLSVGFMDGIYFFKLLFVNYKRMIKKKFSRLCQEQKLFFKSSQQRSAGFSAGCFWRGGGSISCGRAEMGIYKINEDNKKRSHETTRPIRKNRRE